MSKTDSVLEKVKVEQEGNGHETVDLETARKCLAEAQERTMEQFSQELIALCQKHGFALEVESRIVIVPRG